MMYLFFRKINAKTLFTTILGLFFIVVTPYWAYYESKSLSLSYLIFFFSFSIIDLTALHIKVVMDYEHIIFVPVTSSSKFKILFRNNILGYKLIFFIAALLPLPFVYNMSDLFNAYFILNIFGIYILNNIFFTTVSFLIRRKGWVFFIYARTILMILITMLMIDEHVKVPLTCTVPYFPSIIIFVLILLSWFLANLLFKKLIKSLPFEEKGLVSKYTKSLLWR